VRDLRNAHCGKRLPMPAQFLVLLLTLVVEYENLVVTAFLNNLSGYACFRLWPANLALIAGHCQHVLKLDGVTAVAQLLHTDHVSRRDTILFTTGADDRVHNASINANPGAQGRSQGTC